MQPQSLTVQHHSFPVTPISCAVASLATGFPRRRRGVAVAFASSATDFALCCSANSKSPSVSSPLLSVKALTFQPTSLSSLSPTEEKGVLRHPRRMASSPAADVKLAAVALSLNVRLRSADMPAAMQERAFRSARALLDEVDPTSRPNPTCIAMALKKEFDASYGPAWHCVVGKSFGSFMTHSPGGFLYFSLDRLAFLLFKTQVTPVVPPIPDAAAKTPNLSHYS